MVDAVLAATGVLGLTVAALSGRLRRLPVSTAVLGLLAGVLLGPAVLGVVDLGTVLDRHPLVLELTRVLLAVSVMGVALRFPLAELRRLAWPSALLVLVAMPIMALSTAAVAWLTLGAGLSVSLLVGAALCPTDPVLATSAVTGKEAERTLPLRERVLVSAESGANDGLALPVVLVALGVAAGPLAGDGLAPVGEAVARSLVEVVGGVLLGAVAGWLGARALRAGEAHGASEPGPTLFFTLLLGLAVLGAGGLLHVADVLAVFVAGLTFNLVSTGTERDNAIPVDESVDRFGLLPVFLLVGALLPWREWAELGWRGVALVVGVLLLRRLPVVLLLRRPLGLSWAGAGYVGWFGPVGVSALLYLTLEAERLGRQETVLAAGVLVVAASTVVSGVSVPIGLRWYRRVAGPPARSRLPSAGG
ncbi:cation:proton antiporter [Aquipuribacter nitratireducens]|uniref:Cation:proton antiporter n=1 Tax=Aquipuribacter nitratireducens TaxID=650104 RepID=A0ABW0GTT1_9MICO